MRLVFAVEVAGRTGLALGQGARGVRSFTALSARGRAVNLGPHIVRRHRVDEDDEGHRTTSRHAYLTKIHATVHAPDPAVDEPKVRAELIRELRDDAREVLSRFLRFLRALSGEMSIDVHAGTLNTVSASLDDGTEMSIGWADAMQRLAFVGSLDLDHWQYAREQAIAGRDLVIETDWLNEATASLADRNVSATILAAWIACESAIEQLSHILMGKQRPRPKDKGSLAFEALLRSIGIDDSAVVDQLDRTRILRNEIVHDPQSVALTEKAGYEALQSARFLARALRTVLPTT